ncbi:MAG TPA: 4-(cytidine 5'-diphospho)-2-C-methyl-D-erythritol kinase [Tepidisphaeraceae bacterium]|nr:4-(cytidine 5'-diphospho)-2-C-methyl-D-erythritol kinase [Tepidisphaeraceae bacterium]
MHLLAPAKINLHLRVGPRRDDGFHPLLTWMTTVGLFDTLELNAVDAPGGGRIDGSAARLSLATDDPALPTDARNLVVRAASALADIPLRHVGEGPLAKNAVSAFLTKRIPLGAGLGGGSSDSAATLIGLNRLWDAGLSPAELASIGATLGSDVPFFFHGPSSVCSGRGEVVHPIATPAPKWALLVMPKVGITTVSVYATFDAMGLGDDRAVIDEPDWDAWARLDAAGLLLRLVNDLEEAAFAVEPSVRWLRTSLEAKLARPVRMSGSGSTLFTLYDADSDAHLAARQLDGIDACVEVVEVAPRVPSSGTPGQG